MKPVELVVSHLRDRGCKPRRVGHAWKALCPAHDDSNPSLHIAEGPDECAGVKCFADCPTERVLDELGLDWSDLFARRKDTTMPDITATYDYTAQTPQTMTHAPNGFFSTLLRGTDKAKHIREIDLDDQFFKVLEAQAVEYLSGMRTRPRDRPRA